MCLQLALAVTNFVEHRIKTTASKLSEDEGTKFKSSDQSWSLEVHAIQFLSDPGYDSDFSTVYSFQNRFALLVTNLTMSSWFLSRIVIVSVTTWEVFAKLCAKFWEFLGSLCWPAHDLFKQEYLSAKWAKCGSIDISFSDSILRTLTAKSAFKGAQSRLNGLKNLA